MNDLVSALVHCLADPYIRQASPRCKVEGFSPHDLVCQLENGFLPARVSGWVDTHPRQALSRLALSVGVKLNTES